MSCNVNKFQKFSLLACFGKGVKLSGLVLYSLSSCWYEPSISLRQELVMLVSSELSLQKTVINWQGWENIRCLLGIWRSDLSRAFQSGLQESSPFSNETYLCNHIAFIMQTFSMPCWVVSHSVFFSPGKGSLTWQFGNISVSLLATNDLLEILL